jgi:hypothetical protein
MTEALLHYLWKFRLFHPDELQTKAGEHIEIIHPGLHNTNSGPDFLHAKVKIGAKIWAGSIEIHALGNEWYAHQHHLDPAYKNVILHVVLQSEQSVFECGENTTIPCVELQNRIDKNLLARYENLMQNQLPFACANMLSTADELTTLNMLERAAIERLQQKTAHINTLLKKSNNNWEQVCWQMLARYMGGGINSDAMEQTAEKIDVKLFAKHSHEPIQIEALIFGVAGLLQQNFNDDYALALKREFNYLKRLHNLQEVNAGVFKWAKTRPANFPTLRLAQLAAIVNSSSALFSNILEGNIGFIASLLEKATVNAYWKTHFKFDEKAENNFTKIGKNTLQVLIINAVVPLLFAYGKKNGSEQLAEKALAILRTQKAEKNAIVSLFSNYGINSQNALDSQGLIQLKNNYCNPKQCLQCSIGNKILRA